MNEVLKALRSDLKLCLGYLEKESLYRFGDNLSSVSIGALKTQVRKCFLKWMRSCLADIWSSLLGVDK